MDYSRLASQSERMTARAVRRVTVKHEGETYSLDFDPYVPGYRVTDSAGDHVVTLTGKRITQVKRAFREWLEG